MQPLNPPRPRTRPRLRWSILIALGGAAVGFAPSGAANAVPATGSGCAAVHVITARASTEQPGEGVSGALVTQVVNSSQQTVSRASVSYPATLTNYASSSAQGVSALKQQLTQQVQNCPTQKIVLVGYSQGAHVVGDVLGGGGGGSLGATTPPISTTVGDHVVAVVQFGDPRHVINQPFDITDRRGQYDVVITVKGGGLSGQAGAVKHGIAQALSRFEPVLRTTVKQAGFLTRDPRVVERKKYGRAKARRSFQFSKR